MDWNFFVLIAKQILQNRTNDPINMFKWSSFLCSLISPVPDLFSINNNTKPFELKDQMTIHKNNPTKNICVPDITFLCPGSCSWPQIGLKLLVWFGFEFYFSQPFKQAHRIQYYYTVIEFNYLNKKKPTLNYKDSQELEQWRNRERQWQFENF